MVSNKPQKREKKVEKSEQKIFEELDSMLSLAVAELQGKLEKIKKIAQEQTTSEAQLEQKEMIIQAYAEFEEVVIGLERALDKIRADKERK